jgi:hypothetical protein
LDVCDDEGGVGNEGDMGEGDFGTEGSNDVVHKYSSLLLISSNNISLSTFLS